VPVPLFGPGPISGESAMGTSGGGRDADYVDCDW
jgi:hypothetical protein